MLKDSEKAHDVEIRYLNKVVLKINQTKPE
jgi:hypothetical protein